MATYTRRGSRWLVHVRGKGFPTKSKTFNTKAAATAWALDLEGTLLNSPGAVSGQLERQTPLRSIVQRYVDTVTPRKRSRETERYRLLKLLRDPLCDICLADLTPIAIASFRDRRSLEVGAGTLRRELSLLNYMLDLARREWGFPLRCNPVADVEKPRLRNARNRRLRMEEWPALRQCLVQSRNPWILPIVELAIETAMRRGELLDLKWSRINWQTSTADIPQTKTGRPRTIPLTPKAIEILRSLPQCGEYVIPTSANAVKLAWVRSTRRALIFGLRFHDLRHEAVSRFFEMGLSMPEVAIISGHRDPRMLMRNTHLDVINVANKLRDCVRGQGH